MFSRGDYPTLTGYLKKLAKMTTQTKEITCTDLATSIMALMYAENDNDMALIEAEILGIMIANDLVFRSYEYMIMASSLTYKNTQELFFDKINSGGITIYRVKFFIQECITGFTGSNLYR